MEKSSKKERLFFPSLFFKGLQEVIDKYGLSSSANASSVRNALIKKELIETAEGQTYMTDPVMALWMKKSLF